jgi:Uma2 family endonuclease
MSKTMVIPKSYSETELKITLPPTQEELICDDGIPMETQRHKLQVDFLIDQLLLWLEQREDGYVGGNMFVYYSLAQVKNQDFKGPDFFAVLGVPKGERRCWVLWEEEKAPDVVIELLSPTTAAIDKTTKKEIYQNKLRVPEYFWYDPFNPDECAGFVLENGVYQPLSPDQQGRFISQKLGLALIRWLGMYKGVEATWLRWQTLDGVLLPTPEEDARTRVEQEKQRAETAERKLARLEAKLNSLGIKLEE